MADTDRSVLKLAFAQGLDLILAKPELNLAGRQRARAHNERLRGAPVIIGALTESFV